MTINKHRPLPVLLLLLQVTSLLLVSRAVLGETSEAVPTPLQISASKIHLNQANNSMEYLGKVRLSHGSLSMAGSRAKATGKSINSRRVTLSGSPASAQFTSKSGRITHLTSNRIQYNSETTIVTAQGKVRLSTKDGVISAQKIEYNLTTDYCRVTGDSKSPRVSARLKINNKLTDKKDQD